MSLQNLQANFAEILLSANGGTNEAIYPIQNFIIHKNNVVKTLVNTLQDTYPLITRLLGEDFFHLTAREYIKQYPSRSNNLYDYGEYFSDFLTEHPPVKNLIYLAEVAEFEWACHQLFFAADHAAFDISLLKDLAPEHCENLHLVLHPACRAIRFHYPILQLIELCKNNIDEIKDINMGGVNLLIIRPELEIKLHILTLAEFTLLDLLHDDVSLSKALDAALHIDKNFNLADKLPKWVQDKVIVNLRREDPA